MSSRWVKVISDLWSNKTRTFLTVLTIMVGAFAVGFNQILSTIMLADMNTDYQSANPHEAILYAQPFDEDLVKTTRRLPGVMDTEGRSGISSRILLSPERKVNIDINSVPELDRMRLDRLLPADNNLLALGDHELWIEAGSLSVLPVKIGDIVKIEMADSHIRQLRIAGIVRDVTVPPTTFTGMINGYATSKTIEWLGGTASFTRLLIKVSERPTDKPHVEKVAQTVADQFHKAGYETYGTNIYNPGRHFSSDIFQGVTAILSVMGVAIVFLSMFLVINTITVLLAQHIRQIGIMKAIGGRLDQLVWMYITMITSFGVLALAIAIPLGATAAYAAASPLSDFLNFRLQGFRLVPSAIVLQTITALGVPLVAGLVPVFNATRISVREAISTYGLSAEQRKVKAEGPSRFNEFLSNLVSRPLLVSLHNTFRRKGRLVLMLSILCLGGAIFIAVFNLWATFNVVLNEVQGYFLADVNINFSQPYQLANLERILDRTPGITAIEGWGYASGKVLSPDKTSSNNVILLGPPARSKLIKPVITSGRWLQPEDQNAIVIGNHLLKLRPDLKLGDKIIIKIENKETSWTIVGFYKLAGNTDPPLLYTTYEYLMPLTNQNGLAYDLRVITASKGPLAEQQMAKQLDQIFKRKGIQVSQIQLGSEWRAQQGSTLDVLIYFLMTMAALIIVVGSLGLMSTMSMNVLERTREIGILRAIGAPNGAILQLVVVEGLLIGMISWVLAVLASFPLTILMNYGVGAALFQMPLDFTFSWNGLIYWLAGILVLATVSSLLPASKALRLTIRDVLAYE